MSNENEQFAHAWDDEDETELIPGDLYPKADEPYRLQPRSGNLPANETERRPRPRGVPGSAHFYEEIEGDERAARPRPIRQSRAEVEARLRQRARQSSSTRDQDYPRSRSTGQPARKQTSRSTSDTQRFTDYPTPARPTRDFQPGAAPRPTRDFPSSATPRPTRDFPSSATPRPTRDFSSRRPVGRASGANDGYEEFDEIEIIEEPLPRRRHKRGGRVFSTLLTGCLGGIITLLLVAGVLIFLAIHNTPLGQNLGVTNSAFSQSAQQTLDLGSATQLIVKDQAGNVAISVDPNASTASLSSVKHVQASSQNAANEQFKRIVLSVKSIAQGADPACLATTCLLVSATTPATSNGGLLGGGNSPSIDLTLTLPGSFNSPDPTTPDSIAVSANAGNISVSSFNGILNLNGKAGDITVAHTLIFAGTCIQTLHGNITIAQQSIFDLTSPSTLVPCSNTTSTTQHPWFNIQNGVGNVDITLSTNLSNLLLDANTNNGTITDDFNLNISSSDGSDTYHGPLVPNTNPTASLYVAASTGNITLHKQ